MYEHSYIVYNPFLKYEVSFRNAYIDYECHLIHALYC